MDDNMTTERGSTMRALVRRAATVTAIGAIGAGAWLTAAPAPIAVAAVTPVAHSAPALLPAWCPFGTPNGPGSGCRGGSINDNERLNDALADTGQMYKDAGKCAIEGVAKGVTKKDPKKNPATIFWTSQIEGAKCGMRNPNHWP